MGEQKLPPSLNAVFSIKPTFPPSLKVQAVHLAIDTRVVGERKTLLWRESRGISGQAHSVTWRRFTGGMEKTCTYRRRRH